MHIETRTTNLGPVPETPIPTGPLPTPLPVIPNTDPPFDPDGHDPAGDIDNEPDIQPSDDDDE